MRHQTDGAHVEAATADLGKNDEPGNDDLNQDGDSRWKARMFVIYSLRQSATGRRCPACFIISAYWRKVSAV